MKNPLKLSPWLQISWAWVVFIFGHAAAAALGGLMDRWRCPDVLFAAIFFLVDGLVVLCALLLLVVGSWRVAFRLRFKSLAALCFLAAVAVQVYIAADVFIFMGMLVYFKAAGHGM